MNALENITERTVVRIHHAPRFVDTSVGRKKIKLRRQKNQQNPNVAEGPEWYMISINFHTVMGGQRTHHAHT